MQTGTHFCCKAWSRTMCSIESNARPTSRLTMTIRISHSLKRCRSSLTSSEISMAWRPGMKP